MCRTMSFSANINPVFSTKLAALNNEFANRKGIFTITRIQRSEVILKLVFNMYTLTSISFEYFHETAYDREGKRFSGQSYRLPALFTNLNNCTSYLICRVELSSLVML